MPYTDSIVTAKTYRISGAMVTARFGKVIVAVIWVGATYADGEPRSAIYVGEGFKFETARNEAVKIAKYMGA